MRLRYRHRRADLADSDVPISPLLDQTIVLYINVWSIALFLLWMAYHPLPPEGRLPINLSLVDSDPIPLGTRHIVRVTANRGGAIENIAVRDEAAAGWTDIGTDPRVLVGELKRRYVPGEVRASSAGRGPSSRWRSGTSSSTPTSSKCSIPPCRPGSPTSRSSRSSRPTGSR